MTKKSKLIIAGSTVLAGSVITAIAVPLSQKANQLTTEQKQEQEKIPALIEEKQQNGTESGSGEKTKENSGQVETNKQQDDSQKANQPTPEQKQEQQDDDSKKTGENSGQVETNKQQDDSQKANQPTPEQKQEQEKIPALTEEKQQNGAEAGSGGKIEENNKAAESMESQANSQKDSTKEEQQNGAESASGENNKTAEPMKSKVDPQQDSAKEKQQDNGEVGEKVNNSSAVETIKQKATELQSQLTPVNLYFRDKYFFLRLQTSKTTYDKIKNDRLKFILDIGAREYVEQAAEGEQNHQTSYYLNYLDEHNGNVSFEITSDQRYGDKEEEKGTYKVTKVWLSKDPSEKNLLKGESNTVEIPSK